MSSRQRAPPLAPGSSPPPPPSAPALTPALLAALLLLLLLLLVLPATFGTLGLLAVLIRVGLLQPLLRFLRQRGEPVSARLPRGRHPLPKHRDVSAGPTRHVWGSRPTPHPCLSQQGWAGRLCSETGGSLSHSKPLPRLKI